jgi:hypothetical protein
MWNEKQEDVVIITGILRVHDGGVRNFNSIFVGEGQEDFISSKASRPAVSGPNSQIFSELYGALYQG